MKEMILPSNIIALLLLSGILLSAFRSVRIWALLPLLSGSALYLFFTNGFVAAHLISPLEYRYPPIVELAEGQDANAIVLLTAYAADDPRMPLTSRLGASSMYRVVETYRLYEDLDISRIYVSGDGTAIGIMAEMLQALGIPESVIIRDEPAPHTSDSARHIAEELHMEPFYLVTSAGHMPRAIGVFRSAGGEPIPAPTDYQLPRDPGTASIFPDALHLMVADLAIHEYAALAWYRISGKIEHPRE